ncbi:Copper ion binding protein [Thalictrum thalictroides]|uniref:Copper ion binding protein n=1 Tax=Thalictrum thalictroides TaxID=46969 RepID=A0A7J6VGH2_THATH|nr:Copper ion binding protein [Thalictrum thalictroides]
MIADIPTTGPQPEGQATATTDASVTDAKPSDSTSSTSGVSTDKNRNYAVAAGVITGLGALGWYLKATAKKPEVIQD